MKPKSNVLFCSLLLASAVLQPLRACPEPGPPSSAAAGPDGRFSPAFAATAINEIAWELLTHPEVDKRKPEMALSIVEVAEQLAAEGKPESKNAAIMGTRARAMFQIGQKDEAIALQKQAIASRGETKDGLQIHLTGTLAAYEKGEQPAPREEDASPAPAVAKASQLNQVAKQLVAASWKPEQTLKVADAALALAGDKDVRKEILDTRARVAFQAGHKEDAIATEKQAIAACRTADGELKKTFVAALAAFEKDQMPAMASGAPAAAQGTADEKEAPRAYSDEEAMASNEAAWNLLTDAAPTAEQGKKALAIIEPALAGVAKDFEMRTAMLDTKARALFVTGKAKEAIATEKEALAACDEEDESNMEIFTKTIASYEKGVLPPAE